MSRPVSTLLYTQCYIMVLHTPASPATHSLSLTIVAASGREEEGEGAVSDLPSRARTVESMSSSFTSSNSSNIVVDVLPMTPMLEDDGSMHHFQEVVSAKSRESGRSPLKSPMKSPTLVKLLNSDTDYDVNELILKANSSPDHDNCSIEGR